MAEPHKKNNIFLNGFVLFQKPLDPGIIIFWRINGVNDFFVSADKPIIVHSGNEVHRKVCVVSGPRRRYAKKLLPIKCL